MRRADSFEKTLMLGKIEGGRRRDDRGWDGWMASLTQWTWVRVSSRSWWWTGRPGVLQSMRSQRAGHDQVTETNWTTSIQTLVGLQTPCSLWGNIANFPPSLLPQSLYSHHSAYLKWLFPCCLAGSINSGYSCLLIIIPTLAVVIQF